MEDTNEIILPVEDMEQYLTLSEQIKELEILKAGLAAKLLAFMQQNFLKSVHINGYSITHCIRTKYTYSPAIQALEDELKSQKKQWEIQNPDGNQVSYISARPITN